MDLERSKQDASEKRSALVAAEKSAHDKFIREKKERIQADKTLQEKVVHLDHKMYFLLS